MYDVIQFGLSRSNYPYMMQLSWLLRHLIVIIQKKIMRKSMKKKNMFKLLISLIFVCFLVSCGKEENHISDYIKIYDSNVLVEPSLLYFSSEGDEIDDKKINSQIVSSMLIAYDPDEVTSFNQNYEFSGVNVYLIDSLDPIAVLPPNGIIDLSELDLNSVKTVLIEFACSKKNPAVNYSLVRGEHADYIVENGFSRAQNLIQFFGNDVVQLSFPYDEPVVIFISPENGWRISSYSINGVSTPVTADNTGTYMRGSLCRIGADNDWSASVIITPKTSAESYEIIFETEKLLFFRMPELKNYRYELFRDEKFKDRIPYDSEMSGIFIDKEYPIYLHIRSNKEDITSNQTPELLSSKGVLIQDISPINKQKNEWYYLISFNALPPETQEVKIEVKSSLETTIELDTTNASVKYGEDVVIKNQSGGEVQPVINDSGNISGDLIIGNEYTIESATPIIAASTDFTEVSPDSENPKNPYTYSFVVSETSPSFIAEIPTTDVDYDSRCEYEIGGISYTGNPGVLIEDGERINIRARLRYNGAAFSSWANLPSDIYADIDENYISYSFKAGETLPVPKYEQALEIVLPEFPAGYDIQYIDLDNRVLYPGDKLTVLPGDEIILLVKPDSSKGDSKLVTGSGLWAKKKKITAGKWNEFFVEVDENSQLVISIEE